jgi:enterobacterial common antigen flippase
MKGIVGTFRWVMNGKTGVAATIQTLFFQIIIQFTNIATGMITARALGAEGRGELASIILWPNLLGSVFALGLGPALMFNLKKNPEAESELYSASLVMGSFFGLVAAGLGFAFMPLLLKNYSPETVAIARIFVLTAPVNVFTLLILNAYKARNLFRMVNQTDYAAPVMTLGVLAGLGVFAVLTPLTAGLARRGPVILVFLWKFIDLWKYYRPTFQNLKLRMGQLLSYSWRSAPINILSQFADKIDQVLVVGYLTPADMGLYIVALSISRLLNVIQNSILSVLFPRTANKPKQEVAQMAGIAARISILFSLSAAFCLIALGTPIIRLYGGANFLSAVPVFQLLSVEIVIKGATLVLAQTFMAVGRPGVVSTLQGLGLGLSFPLMSILIPKYQLFGAGLALLCSTSVRLVFIMSCYPLILKIRPPSLLPTVGDLRYLRNAIQNRKS